MPWSGLCIEQPSKTTIDCVFNQSKPVVILKATSARSTVIFGAAWDLSVTASGDQSYLGEAKLFYACVCCNKTILAECDDFSQLKEDEVKQVQTVAKKMVDRRIPPGWDDMRIMKNNFRALKFAVHDEEGMAIVMCVVHRPNGKVAAKAFLEKITLLSEPLHAEWRQSGTMMSAQGSFGPTLKQQLDHNKRMSKVARVQEEVSEVKDIMAQNVDLIMERGEKLEDLQEKSDEVMALSKGFKKATGKLKRFHMWQQAKYGLAAGTAVTVAVAVPVAAIVVPAAL